MDDFASLLIYIATFAVVIDYGMAGMSLHRAAKDIKQTTGQTNIFLSGLSDLFFFDVVMVSFWPAVLIINLFAPIVGLVLHLVAAAYLILCSFAIIGRRRWWKNLVEPVVSGGSERNEER